MVTLFCANLWVSVVPISSMTCYSQSFYIELTLTLVFSYEKQQKQAELLLHNDRNDFDSHFILQER